MVYMFLANGFEEVEALTTLDFLRRCEAVQVKTVAVENRLVTGSHQITVLADLLMREIDLSSIEMVILPGGMPGTLHLEQSQGVQEVLEYCKKEEKYIAAICAAPSILGHKGWLAGKKATCYVGFEQELTDAKVTQNAVEQDGIFITARGAGVASQFAFHLLKVLQGQEASDKVRAAVLWED